MSVDFYTNSKGQQVRIDTMPAPHLVNAHAKLAREGDPARAAEIEAMAAQIAINDAAHAELSEERGDDPAPIGHNMPPEPTPAVLPGSFDSLKVHCDDLLIEVRNWADGAKIESRLRPTRAVMQ